MYETGESAVQQIESECRNGSTKRSSDNLFGAVTAVRERERE